MDPIESANQDQLLREEAERRAKELQSKGQQWRQCQQACSKMHLRRDTRV